MTLERGWYLINDQELFLFATSGFWDREERMNTYRTVKARFCSQHERKQERERVLDDCCNIDLTYYVWGEKESEDVGLCRGIDCNYCGRYNVRKGEP